MTARKPAAKSKLPNVEIATLADQAWLAWESGSEEITTDSRGDRWEFEPQRETIARLELRRVVGEDPPRRAVIDGAALGADQPQVRLASLILALSEPV